MKALTLYQPWASLIALGVKTIETRSWATSYRGPLAIHAGKLRLHLTAHEGDPGNCHGRALAAATWRKSSLNAGPSTLPLGAVVATCELVDCLPIGVAYEGDDCLVVHPDGQLDLALRCDSEQLSDSYVTPEVAVVRLDAPNIDADACLISEVTDQRPYGDFAPGRYAWLLENVKPVDPPVPATGHQDLWEWDDPRVSARGTGGTRPPPWPRRPRSPRA